jgi:hypothetical protein
VDVLDENESSFQFDGLSEESPSLAGMHTASVQGRVSMGQRAGRRVRTPPGEPGMEHQMPWWTK